MRESDRLIFGPEIVAGKPALPNVALSVVLHAAAIAVIVAIPSRPPTLREEILDHTVPSPTEIRIGDRIYFVADLSQADKAKTEQAKARKAAGKPAPRPSKPKADEAKLTAPAPPQAAPPSPATRAYVPPEIRRDQNATQVLIQPQSPPDLMAPSTALPTFRVTTEQTNLPKFRKAFVVPGRQNPAPVAAPPELQLPDVELAHADPVPNQTEAKLVLPRPPAPPPPPAVPVGPAPVPVGDPVNIFSLSDRATPVSARLVVPPGNVAPAKNGDRSGATATGTSQPGKSGDPASTANGSGTGGANSSAGNTANNNPANNNSANNAANNSSNNKNGSGTSPSPAPAGPAITITGPGGTGSGVKAGSPASTPAVITRPATGSFDAVVVQTSPLDQYPESRGLLKSKPIYSVYVSVGAAMDWTLFFCVPDATKPVAAPAKNQQVVELGGAPPPVKAPFPTRVVRPPITLPSFQKYILVHGFVTAEGRFENLSIVRPVLPATDQAVLASLTGWEFRAATKDGVPVAVEFLLSIPARGLL